MTVPRILLADNDVDFLNTRKEFLEQAGYRVITATDPSATRDALSSEEIELAILDIRLNDDDDERDTSGLSLVQSAAYRNIPKIILTNYSTSNIVRDVLRLDTHGSPLAFDVLNKSDGPEVMIQVVERALTTRLKRSSLPPNLQTASTTIAFDLAAHLNKEYETARNEAIWNNRARLVLALIGAVIVLGGGIVTLIGYIPAGALGAVSGIFTEGLALLFSRIANEANRRRDLYHQELLWLYKQDRKTTRKK